MRKIAVGDWVRCRASGQRGIVIHIFHGAAMRGVVAVRFGSDKAIAVHIDGLALERRLAHARSRVSQ